MNDRERNFFQRLHDRFEDPYSPNLGYELRNYLNAIKNEFVMYMSMTFYSPTERSEFHANDLWSVSLIEVMSGFILLIDDLENKERYEYRHPEKNTRVLSNWLRYYRTKCEDNGIIIFE